jgi:hypothetical protein
MFSYVCNGFQVFCKCFRCLLLVFHLDVVKVDLVLHMLQCDSPTTAAAAPPSRIRRCPRTCVWEAEGARAVPRMRSGGTGRVNHLGGVGPHVGARNGACTENWVQTLETGCKHRKRGTDVGVRPDIRALTVPQMKAPFVGTSVCHYV